MGKHGPEKLQIRTLFTSVTICQLILKRLEYDTSKYAAPKCGALRDLVAFAQFKKREKQPWRSANFSKIAGFSLQLY